MSLETLNEEDLDWLTRVENRLSTMRKRETEHRGARSILVEDISYTIKRIRELRIMLQARFGKAQDEYL